MICVDNTGGTKKNAERIGKKGFSRHTHTNKSHLDLMVSGNRDFKINIQVKHIVHPLLMKKTSWRIHFKFLSSGKMTNWLSENTVFKGFYQMLCKKLLYSFLQRSIIQ